MKKIKFALVALALVLIVSVVYAAATEFIITGTVNLSDVAKIEIVPAGANTGWSISGDKATIETDLAAPGDSQTFTFNVKNAGNKALIISAIAEIDNEAAGIISITNTSLPDNVLLDINETTVANYLVTVTWLESASEESGSYTFTITISYEIDE